VRPPKWQVGGESGRRSILTTAKRTARRLIRPRMPGDGGRRRIPALTSNRSRYLWFSSLFAAWPATAFASNGTESIGVSQQAMARGGGDLAIGDSALSQ